MVKTFVLRWLEYFSWLGYIPSENIQNKMYCRLFTKSKKKNAFTGSVQKTVDYVCRPDDVDAVEADFNATIRPLILLLINIHILNLETLTCTQLSSFI